MIEVEIALGIGSNTSEDFIKTILSKFLQPSRLLNLYATVAFAVIKNRTGAFFTALFRHRVPRVIVPGTHHKLHEVQLPLLTDLVQCQALTEQVVYLIYPLCSEDLYASQTRVVQFKDYYRVENIDSFCIIVL